MANRRCSGHRHFDGSRIVDIFRPETDWQRLPGTDPREDIHLPEDRSSFLLTLSTFCGRPVDNYAGGFQSGKIKFFRFSVLHKTSEILFLSGCPDCPGLVNGKALHEPAEFLPAQEAGLGSVPGPLEPAAPVKTFLEQHKSIFIEMKCFKFPAVSSAEQIEGICVRVKLIDVTDNGHESIEALSHISPACYDENF